MAGQKRYTKTLQVPVTDEFHKMFTERADKDGKRVGELAREILQEDKGMTIQEQLLEAIKQQLLKDPDVKVKDSVVTDLVLGKKETK